jgi:hypothetical protein
MSNELESERAMVMNLESFGVDGVGYDEDDRAAKTRKRNGHLTDYHDESTSTLSSLLCCFVPVDPKKTLRWFRFVWLLKGCALEMTPAWPTPVSVQVRQTRNEDHVSGHSDN